MKRAIIVLVILGALGAGGWAYYVRENRTEMSVDTTPVSRGDVVETVGSTGTLQAVTTVQVGSQVSGNIQWLGADFNAIVKKDQVIAKLDPSLIQAQIDQQDANLAQARASLNKANSDLDRMKVQLTDSQQKFTRAKELAAKQLETQSDLDAAKIAVDSAQASLASQVATVKQSEAAVTQSEAQLNQQKVNLEHTIITAPIDGIVTQRSVDVGQTVNAGMSAPTLFIIAADLTKMQVSANIDESDVGKIRPGQLVTFRVDAYPTKTYQGTVTQIRLQPVVQSNVTTYGTIIDVPNPDLELKPGMTANLKVEIHHQNNAVRIPNAALRFRPTTDMFAALNQPVPPEALAGAGRGGRGGGRNGGGFGGRNAGGGGANANAPAGAAAGAAGAAPGGQAQNGAAAGAGQTASADQGQGRRNRGQGGGQGGGNFAGGGRGQGGGFGGGRGGGQQMMDRFNAMSPEDQQAFIDRMKGRGGDVTAFVAAQKKSPGLVPKYGQTTAASIDALFPPLVSPNTAGRVWLYVDKQLKPVNLRLGITDGTYTEVISGDTLQQGEEVVTGITGVGPGRNTGLGGRGGNNGNPLLGNQPRGGGPGGFGGPPGGFRGN